MDKESKATTFVTVPMGTYSASFVNEAIAIALGKGAEDARGDDPGVVLLIKQTPNSTVLARAEADAIGGELYVDRLAEGSEQLIGLSMTCYDTGTKEYVTYVNENYEDPGYTQALHHYGDGSEGFIDVDLQDLLGETI